MKRFFRFVFRLLLFAALVAALILLGILVVQVDGLSKQVDELTARVQRIEEANAARSAPGSQVLQPTQTHTTAPTATHTPRPTSTPRPTPWA